LIGQLWRVAEGDVRVAVDEAEWCGASLSVLIAAVHHPAALATCRPESDPVEVARDVLTDVAELYAAAAAVADAQARRADPGDRPASVSVRRDGAEIVFAPGAEVADLARCLGLFASAVVDRCGADEAAARGATEYVWGGGVAGPGGGRGALGGGVGVQAVVPEPGQAPAIPPRRARRHHRPRIAAAPEAEAAMIRQAWAERTRPRRRERVPGVHPAG
jgi:hypothetical protein